MDNVLKEAILNGLYDKDKNSGNEFFSPQLVSNDKENKIWFTLRQELLSSTSLLGQLLLFLKICLFHLN